MIFQLIFSQIELDQRMYVLFIYLRHLNKKKKESSLPHRIYHVKNPVEILLDHKFNIMTQQNFLHPLDDSFFFKQEFINKVSFFKDFLLTYQTKKYIF